jgi:hypothetical protein
MKETLQTINEMMIPTNSDRRRQLAAPPSQKRYVSWRSSEPAAWRLSASGFESRTPHLLPPKKESLAERSLLSFTFVVHVLLPARLAAKALPQQLRKQL